ncbi:hypothetical protein [Propionivibrio sp.]|nr:hypothetical protein [Propionivibrio sp.]
MLSVDERLLHGRPIFDLFADDDSRQNAGRLLVEQIGQVLPMANFC